MPDDRSVPVPVPESAPTERAETAATPAVGPALSLTRRRSRLARLGRLLLLGLGPLLLLLGGTYYVISTARYVTTENAYLKSDKIAVTADVTGLVSEVAVAENQTVTPGQLLFLIDQQRYRIALDQREAALQAARQEVETLRALYRQKRAELDAAQAEIAFFESEFLRAESLKKGGHVSSANFDRSRRDLMMSRHQVEAVREDIIGVLARLGGDPAVSIDDHPSVMVALTQWEQAELDLQRTRVVAPAAAIVSNIELQAGEYVEAGDPVFSLVDTERVWIEANLKETDLTHVRVGQLAQVTVDAYPDHAWQAEVSSIAPATGAEFALLPPQNASGNWVKVVQRVPLRLELKRDADDPPLRAGMSVSVEIDTGVEPELPSIVSTAFAWVTGKQ